jgi:hypothetical protein
MDETKLEYLLRDKLENYETPVDPADWDVIRRRLRQQEHRKIAAMWLSVGAAAAVALLFMLYHPSVTEYSPLVPTMAVVTPLSISTPGDVQQPAPMLANSASTATRKTVAPMPEKPLLDTARHETPATTNMPADTAQTAAASQATAAAKEEKAETPVRRAPQDSSFTALLAEAHTPPEQTKRKKWALAALANQSGSIDFPNATEMMDEPYALNDVSAGSFAGTEHNMLNEPVKTSHHIPLSFGVTFRFYFTPRWAIESGLVYTYLSSEYKYADGYRLKQQLHYLGLPLHAVFQFAGGRRFSAYLSGGGMLEKGLSAHYSLTAPASQTDSRESIAGWQWSLSGQLGGSCHLSKRFSLYVEPGVRYFFPAARQPESMRTEQPFHFALGFGLRANF